MSKNNLRSFRYSDEVKEILENFEGNSMNDKFENLIQYCFIRVPIAEKKLARIENEIHEKYKKLSSIKIQSREINTLIDSLEDIKDKIEKVAKHADTIIKKSP